MSIFLGKFISRLLASLILIYFIDFFVPAVKVMIFPGSNFFGLPLTEKWQVYLILAFSFALINSFLKPILDFFTFPLRFLTFGLFTLVVNMFLLKLLDWAFNEFLISGLFPLFLSAVLLSLINGLFGIK
ncbi:MAG: phage holin family protein, partial [Minisyncoccales bacterium]